MNWVHELRAQVPVTKICTYLDCAYDCGGTTFGAAAARRVQVFVDRVGGRELDGAGVRAVGVGIHAVASAKPCAAVRA